MKAGETAMRGTRVGRDRLSVRRVADGWTAFEDVDQVSRVYGPEERADAWVARERKRRRTVERRCIACRTVFASKGPHNRMCSACRSGATAGCFEDAVRIGS